MSAVITNMVNAIRNNPGWFTNPSRRDEELKKVLFPLGFVEAGEGQNRLVVTHAQAPGRVFKIAHREPGLRDNMGEYIVSLLYGNAMVAKPLMAKALVSGATANPDVNSYLIIEETLAECIKDYVIRTQGNNNVGYNSVKFMLKNFTAYRELIKALNQSFFIYDAHPKQPFNFGIINGNLVTLDYGYYLPYKDTNSAGLGVDRPVCPKCGGKMVYMIPEINMNMSEADQVARLTSDESPESAERYICQSGCTIETSAELFAKLYSVKGM